MNKAHVALGIAVISLGLLVAGCGSSAKTEPVKNASSSGQTMDHSNMDHSSMGHSNQQPQSSSN